MIIAIILVIITIVIVLVFRKKNKPTFKVTFTLLNEIKITGEKLMISGFENQTAESTEDIQAVYVDSNGNETVADVETGSIEWSSSDASVMEVTEAADNEKRFAVKLLPTDSIVLAQVICKGDADLGEGVESIEAVVLSVENKPRQATGFREAAISPFHD